MDKNADLYYQSACALRLPLTKVDWIEGFQINIGKRPLYFRGADTPFNYGSSIGVASNKFCMNKVLEAAGFPMPKAKAFHKLKFEQESLDVLINDLKFPLVVKPMAGTCWGTDVLCNLQSIEQLKTYMNKCYQKYNFLSVEEFHANLNSYRVLVFFNKVIGVVQRFPAHVVGDGTHTLLELIDLQNIAREKFKHTVTLSPIKVDEEVLIRLKELGLTLDYIPKDQETVVLCYTCNASRGGAMKSLGKTLCKENAKLLCDASTVLNLNLVGFDVICEDINIPITQSKGLIIEANHNPDITIHESPMSGTPVQVTKIMLRRLIFKHPVAYLLSRYQDKNNRLYVHFFVLCLILFTAMIKH